VLGDNGVSAVAYHAGMERDRRASNQDRFMRGSARVVVATVAFGMGIDKPDVRFIIHFSPSTSLEAYAQESGRAGRDGDDSRCVLLYTSSDRANQTRLARRDSMDLDTLRQVYAGVKRNAVGSWAIFEPSRIALRPAPGDDPDDAPDPRIGIGLLEQGGLLERHPNAPFSWTLTRRNGASAEADMPSGDGRLLWQRFAEWSNLAEPGQDRKVVNTAAACSALDISPESLALLLDEHPAWDASEGDRLTCLQLLPVGENAAATLQRVLDDAAARASARVGRTMSYAEGHRCRHAAIAAHLGERLAPCGEACDVCTGESANARLTRGSRASQPKKRTTPTAADALAALMALASAPFPLGKTGLTRLLEGSIQSRIQADRSAYFGALSDLQKSKIEAVIEGLVQDNLLVHDHSRSFPVLRLTPQGQQQLQEAANSE
jgi:ATP-dependent DNA helicase RecQ